MSPTFDLSALSSDARASGVWATALLFALARDEAEGRRRARLTEEGHATWARFRGRLTSADWLALLFEDAAVLHPVPFDPAALGAELDTERLPDEVVDGWLEALRGADLRVSGPDYVAEQARRLGISTRLARSDLHVVKTHHKVLELPGTGGLLAHHLVSQSPELSLKESFTVACGSWEELTLAGVVALDLGAPDSSFAERVELESLRSPGHPIRQRSFDLVIGRHPDKGGMFRAEDQLSVWFPSAKILLV